MMVLVEEEVGVEDLMYLICPSWAKRESICQYSILIVRPEKVD